MARLRSGLLGLRCGEAASEVDDGSRKVGRRGYLVTFPPGDGVGPDAEQRREAGL